MRTLHARILGLVVAVGVALAGCASDPAAPEPTPVGVRFIPSPGTINSGALAQFEFYAETTDGQELAATFYLNDTEVSQGTRFGWQAAVLGETRITAVTQFDGVEHRGEWTVHVNDDGELPSPVVISVTVEPGDVPGSLKVEWEAPGGTSYTVDPKDFLVAWSSAPLTEENFDAAAQTVVPWVRAVITQTTLVEGLVEQADYYVSVRTRDLLDRLSDLSPSRQGRATGHFDVSGSVCLLLPDVPARPLGGVLLDWNGIKTVSTADGAFALPNLADTVLQPLEAREGSGLDYYSVVTQPLEPVDQSFELVLFPRDFVSLVIDSVPTEMPRLDFMLLMSNNTRPGSDMEVRRWATYPVPVYMAEYVNQGDELVDYRAAFEWAVAIWNQAASFDLMVMVESPPTDGIVGQPRTLQEMGNSIGRTNLLRPPGNIFEEIPEFVEVALRDNFRTQVLANRIVAHELGHAVLVPHSPDASHLMHSTAPASSGGVPNRDVAFAARLIASMNVSTRLDWYVVPD